MKILAIETSCDETAAAVVENGVHVVSSVVASSTDMHQKYGGIVPEVAAREQLRVIIPVIKEALKQAHLTSQAIDQIAVTVGPGLIGSLLIGVETAKTMAVVTQKPIIPVNHVIAHMYANFVQPSHDIQFPAISLVVSGGHTELFLMESVNTLTWLGGTIDDAAGEAFDKTARLLGFSNGGGAAIQKAAENHTINNSPADLKLPRPLMDNSLNFSFSGLKTAVVRAWEKVIHDQPHISAFAYEIQEAITDVLVTKTLQAATNHHAKSILISGGVAANLRLRDKFSTRVIHFPIHAPPVALCTDNAVYISAYAFFKGKPVDWHTITALPDLSVEENI